MNDIPVVLPPLIGEVGAWLQKNNITPAGPPFFQYRCVGEKNNMEVAVGFPVAEKIKGDNHVMGGSFPAGRYAVVTHIGEYMNLKDTHMFLQSWVDKSQLKEVRKYTQDGVEWGSRAESYITDYRDFPNPEDWKTEVSFLLAD
jgi:effector-binding domain-containing protein